jgi:CBS domain-containing protein
MKMKEIDVGAIPVFEGDRLVGMVTDRDIVVRAVAAGKNPADTTAKEVMAEGVIYSSLSMRRKLHEHHEPERRNVHG